MNTSMYRVLAAQALELVDSSRGGGHDVDCNVSENFEMEPCCSCHLAERKALAMAVVELCDEVEKR